MKQSSQKTEEKVLFTLRRKLPYFEITVLAWFLFLVCLAISRFLITDEAGYIWAFAGGMIGFSFFVYVFDNSCKSLLVADNHIEIKTWLTKRKTMVPIKEIKGYEKREVYTRFGLTDHVRIVTRDNRIFEFIPDNYSNFRWLPKGLSRTKIQYLGRVEIKSKYKYLITQITALSSLIAILLFFLLQLIKLFR
jgi:hypothetical protein